MRSHVVIALEEVVDSIYCNLRNHLTEENIPICLSISWWARLSNDQLTAGYLVVEKLQIRNKNWQRDSRPNTY